MADDIPTPAKGVYIYFDYIALGFVLVGTEELVRHPGVWRMWVTCLVLGAAFLFFGVMGQQIKSWLYRLVGSLRKSKALTVALAENAELKNQIQDLKTAIATIGEQTAREYDRERKRQVDEFTEKLKAIPIIGERERQENLFLKTKVSDLENKLADEKRISAANREQIGEYTGNTKARR